jgi:hypothetical protein
VAQTLKIINMEKDTIKIPAYFNEIELCVANNALDKALYVLRKQVTLHEVFIQMYSDTTLKALTETVLNSVGTKQYKQFKTSLPAFVLGRHYKQGSYTNTETGENFPYPFKSLSNYFAVDVDGFNNKNDLNTVFEQLKTVPYVCCVFPSPSRLGFRAIVKTDFESPNFELYTDSKNNLEKDTFVNEKFKPATEYILKCVGRDSSIPVKSQVEDIAISKGVVKTDTANYIKKQGLYHIDVLNDVSRMWFFSSVLKQDNELIYINEDPTSLAIDYSKIKVTQSKKETYKKNEYTGQSNTELDRFNAEFDLMSFLESQGFGKVGGYGNTIRMLSSNSSSAKSGDYIETGPYGVQVYVNYSSSCELSNYKDTNKAFNAYECVKFLEFKGDKGKTFEHLNKLGYNVKASQKESFSVTNTYYIGTSKNDVDYAIFDYVNFIKFLNLQGFRKVTNDVDFDLIKLDGLICQKVTITEISDFIKDCISKALKDDFKTLALVFDTHMKDFKKIYSEGVLDMLRTIEINTFQDTLAESFVMYKNGLLKITKDGVEFSNEKNRFIWVENTVNRNFDIEKFNAEFKGFDLDKDSLDFSSSKQFNHLVDKSDFAHFVALVMESDPDRFLSCISVFGYLINTYRDPTNPRAVIFCDQTVSDQPQGGSGKGLFLKAVSKMRLTTSISGKNFDPSNQFCFAGFRDNSNVLVIDDIVKNFDFENLFFYMTEGLVIRKLHQNPIMLDGANFPKIALTTNYTVLGDSSSHERRKIEIELFNHFSNEYKPTDLFKKSFWGDSWNDEDWFYFDSFMLICVHYFIQKGLVFPKSVNLDFRKLLQSTNPDFVEFMNEIVKEGYSDYTKELYEQFKNENIDFDNNKFKIRTFTKWVTDYDKYRKKLDSKFHLELKRRGKGAFIDINAQL